MKHQKPKSKNQAAFVLLFAVTISAIILSIALGIANVSLNELQFSTSGKDTGEAFSAADTGVECALFNDKTSNNKFPLGGPATQITCSGTSVTPSFSAGSNTGTYNFTVENLGNSGESCVKVTVVKDNTVTPMNTIITSRGYNKDDSSCNSTSTHLVERELRVSFEAAP